MDNFSGRVVRSDTAGSFSPLFSPPTCKLGPFEPKWDQYHDLIFLLLKDVR